MKISLNWIRDYVDIPADLDVRQVMHDLTMTTVEVEAAHDLGKALAGVRVALVEGKLTAVTADTSSICTADQLGLTDLFPTAGHKSPIDLSGLTCDPGTPLADAIGWNDTVLEIDNKSLTNRPDLWSHYGIARELGAIYHRPLKPLPARPAPWPSAELLTIAADACNRLSLMHIANVRTEPAPFWMRSRLAGIGQRPINLWVDITNYVMFAVGQPCHAYDMAHLSMPLVTHLAKDGAPIDLIDAKPYTLDARMLAISDTKGLVALAGIMGGRDSAIRPETTEILFEAGNFDALTVRKAGARLGLRTEASTRFEKALDTQRVDDGLALFASLLHDIQPLARVKGFQDLHPRPTRPAHLVVDLPFIEERLGKALQPDEVSGPLTSLGFQVTAKGAVLEVTAPTWRSTGDISLQHDLLEEIARLRGYDTFDFVPPTVQLRQQTVQPRHSLERRLKSLLTLAGGMQEVVTYPWAHDLFLEAAGMHQVDMLTLAVAPGLEQRHLRPSLIPNLLEVVAKNVTFLPSFRVFEFGRTFGAATVPGDAPNETLTDHPRYVAGAFVGADGALLFRQAKGLLEAVQRIAHVTSFGFSKDAAAPWADATARLGIHAGGAAIGTLGILTRRARRLAGVKRGEVVAFELNVDLLQPLPSRENRYTAVPEQPEVIVDISLTFRDEVSWETIDQRVGGSDPLIRQVSFVDEYRGPNVPPGHKSVTLRLRLGADQRTLTSEEVNEVRVRTMSLLTTSLGAGQRAT